MNTSALEKQAATVIRAFMTKAEQAADDTSRMQVTFNELGWKKSPENVDALISLVREAVHVNQRERHMQMEAISQNGVAVGFSLEKKTDKGTPSYFAELVGPRALQELPDIAYEHSSRSGRSATR